MKCLRLSIVLCIATCALTLTGCASLGERSKPLTGERPAADLLASPPTFSKPPVTADPQTGEPTLQGRDALPWALDTLSVGGDIRAKFIRLQAWVKTLLGDAPPPTPKE